MCDVLVVDDEEDIREVVTEVLKNEGFTVVAASGVEEAELAINSDEPKVIPPDLYLRSERNGLALIKWLQGTAFASVVVVMSGLVSTELTTRAREKAWAFMSKPFSVEHLLCLVREGQKIWLREAWYHSAWSACA
jgi:two-component system nitrogen regulation response regulator NtrX